MFQLFAFFLWISLMMRSLFGESLTREGIHVFLATDGNMTRPTCVAITSLLENGSPHTFYHVYVMIPGNYEPENRKIIELLDEKYENCRLSLVNMGRMFEEDEFGRFSAPTFYRQEIPRLFPDLKRCVFLDGDVIVRHDLSAMVKINLDNHYAAGIVEYWYAKMRESKIRAKALEIPDVKGYICTGVMIMNLESMRANGIVEKISEYSKAKIRVLRENPEAHPDQDVLNGLWYGKTVPLPHEFGVMINFRNRFPESEWKEKDPTIIHFAAQPKPWDDPKTVKIGEWSVFHEEFWHYAEKTGLYGVEIEERKKQKTQPKNSEI